MRSVINHEKYIITKPFVTLNFITGKMEESDSDDIFDETWTERERMNDA